LKSEAGKLWEHAQDRQKTKLQLRSNALKRKIDAWTNYQKLYCPCVERLRASSVTESNQHIPLQPQNIPLWLPSQIKNLGDVPKQLQTIEWRLRLAQAYEVLDMLRSHLQVRAYLYKFKDRFVRGQGANTRARNTINGVQVKIDAASEEYSAAYEALLSLSVLLLEYSWKEELHPLMPSDIRDLSEGKAGESEGKRTISWIWRTTANNITTDEPGFLQDRKFSLGVKSSSRLICYRYSNRMVEIACSRSPLYRRSSTSEHGDVTNPTLFQLSSRGVGDKRLY